MSTQSMSQLLPTVSGQILAEHDTHGSKETQSSTLPSSGLLQLPVEILLQVFDCAESDVDYICLAYTSRHLYDCSVLSSRPLSSRGKNAMRLPSRREWLQHWECATCHTHHRATPSDSPTSSAAVKSVCPVSYRTHGYYTALPTYRLCHRHIVQALKYSEGRRRNILSKNQMLHFGRLLAEHHTIAFISESCWNEYFKARPSCLALMPGESFPEPKVQCRHSVFPRIDHDRFLLMSLWIYCGPPESINEQSGERDIMICKHQGSENPWARVPALAEMRRHIYRNRKRPSYSTLRNTDTPVPMSPDSYWFQCFSRAEGEAVLHPGREVRGSCPFCPTDFAVTYLPQEHQLVFCSWQDMGSSLMAEDHAARKIFSWRHVGTERIWHSEGSVRALYERAPDGEGRKTGEEINIGKLATELKRSGPGFHERYETLEGDTSGFPPDSELWGQSYSHRASPMWSHRLEDPERHDGIPQDLINNMVLGALAHGM